MVKIRRAILTLIGAAVLALPAGAAAAASGAAPERWLVELEIKAALAAAGAAGRAEVFWRNDETAVLAVAAGDLEALASAGAHPVRLARLPENAELAVFTPDARARLPAGRRPDAHLAAGQLVYLLPPGFEAPPDWQGYVRIGPAGRPLSVLAARPYGGAARPGYDPFFQSLVDEVDSGRLYELLLVLTGFGTRFTPSAGCFAAADWAAAHFAGLGLETELFDWRAGRAPNVIARQSGAVHPERIWIVCGHLDSTSGQASVLAPGADDNGTGSALTLHAAEVLSRAEFEDTILYCLWTGEEQGLLGSDAWAGYAAAQDLDILGCLNFDMVGWSEPDPESLDLVVNQASLELEAEFSAAARSYTGLAIERRVLPNVSYSDHWPFWMLGYPAFTGIEDHPINYPYYHTVNDTADKVDVAFLADCTRAAVAGLASLGGARPAATPTPGPTPTPEAFSAGLILPGWIRPGESFFVTGRFENPGPETIPAALAFVLDVHGRLFFWPGWEEYSPQSPGTIDYRLRELAPGITDIGVVPAFAWPDTGTQTAGGLLFHGAALTPELDGLLAPVATVEWGYGPW